VFALARDEACGRHVLPPIRLDHRVVCELDARETEHIHIGWRSGQFGNRNERLPLSPWRDSGGQALGQYLHPWLSGYPDMRYRHLTLGGGIPDVHEVAVDLIRR
jgi:hypothetical protein